MNIPSSFSASRLPGTVLPQAATPKPSEESGCTQPVEVYVAQSAPQPAAAQGPVEKPAEKAQVEPKQEPKAEPPAAPSPEWRIVPTRSGPDDDGPGLGGGYFVQPEVTRRTAPKEQVKPKPAPPPPAPPAQRLASCLDEDGPSVGGGYFFPPT